jgi:phage shock protein E
VGVVSTLPLLVLATQCAFAAQNPAIDVDAYRRDVAAATLLRADRLVSEDEFIRMSRLPGTVIIDARSRPKYDALHVRGAINVTFPDFTAENLAAAVPDKSTRILIYCNNNFRDAPDPMPTKMPAAALNLATYTALYTYGYRNVYELQPLLSVSSTNLDLIGITR